MLAKTGRSMKVLMNLCMNYARESRAGLGIVATNLHRGGAADAEGFAKTTEITKTTETELSSLWFL